MKLRYILGTCSQSVHIALREAGMNSKLDKMSPATRRTESGDDYLHTNPKGSTQAAQQAEGLVK